MVERAVELGMPALALTDHGVMYGAIELLNLCTKAGIKPIIGNEMYVINGSIDDPQPKKERRYHLVVLARNGIPCARLVPLSPSLAGRQGFREITVKESHSDSLPESELVASAMTRAADQRHIHLQG
jgi:DNA polymerase-3 subunit alpha